MRPQRLSLAALLACAAPIAAQCPVPAVGFEPGGAGAPILDFATLDLGAGPALYAGGRFSTIGDVVAKGVARWDGQTWAALGAGIDLTGATQVSRLVALDFGGPRLCAVGTFTNAGGLSARGVALWDGQQWDTLAGGPTPPAGSTLSVLSAAVFDEGSGPRLFVGGSVRDGEFNDDPFLARFDGTSWTTVAGAPTSEPCDPLDYYCTRHGSITGLVTWDDGAGSALFVGGDFERVAGAPGFNFARWNGAAWSIPGGPGLGGAAGAVSAMTLHDDGSGTALYVFGGFPANSPHPYLVRWNGSAFSALSPAPVGGGQEFVSLPALAGAPAGLWLLPTGPGQDSLVHAKRWDGTTWSAFDIPLDYYGDTYALGAFDGGGGANLFLGGDYHQVGGATAASLGRFDGVTWWAMGAGLGFTDSFNHPGHVAALAVHDDGSGPALYAGGKMTWSGGATLDDFVRWNGSDWQRLPTLVQANHNYITDMISADVGQGPSLYVSGSVRVGFNNLVGFARWNGTSFDTPGLSTYDPDDMAVFDFGTGAKLYVANGSSLVRFDNPGFSTIQYQSTNTRLRALCVHDDGSGPALYVGGSFAGFGGAISRGVVRWDGTSWSAVGTGLGFGFGDAVEVLRTVHQGTTTKLVAGGSFNLAGGLPVSNLAIWDGQSWSDLGGGVGGTGARVYALEEFDDGQGEGRALFVGGRFTSAGGAPAANLARWNGQSWSAANLATAGQVPTVRALLTADLPALGGRVLSVAGDFESVGPVPQQRYARLQPCDQTGEVHCFGDGTASPCPCGNASAPGANAGCLNSLGLASTLRAHGSASLSNDTLVLEGASMPPSSGLYFQGASALNMGLGVPFGDGLRCLAGPYRRLASELNVNGASSYPNLTAGELSVSIKGMILSPGTFHYQIWYRNPAAFCTSATFNYTNAIAIVWGL